MQSPYQIMQSKSKSPKSKILSQLSQLQTCNFNEKHGMCEQNIENTSRWVKIKWSAYTYNN